MVRSATALFLLLVIFKASCQDNCQTCNNCCNDNCVSGEMKVAELTKGVVSVSLLSAGDIIRGLRGPEKTPDWCRVDAVYPRAGYRNFTTYNGFTREHMIIDGNTVRPHGDKGDAVSARLYTLATECDAAVNAAGEAFTPFSTTFCPHELAWDDYIVLMEAIRRVTSRTGYFWYLSDAFHDSDAANVPKWANMLPDMCAEMLRCAREGKCQKFENIVAEFVREHLNEKYVLTVRRVFPNLGGDVSGHETGTVSYVVRQDGKANIALISTLAAIGFMLVVNIAVLAFFLVRVVKKRSNEELPEKPGLDNVSPASFNYEKA